MAKKSKVGKKKSKVGKKKSIEITKSKNKRFKLDDLKFYAAVNFIQNTAQLLNFLK